MAVDTFHRLGTEGLAADIGDVGQRMQRPGQAWHTGSIASENADFQNVGSFIIIGSTTESAPASASHVEHHDRCPCRHSSRGSGDAILKF